MGKLDGKVALVSGAGRGIGAEIARKLAADGAAVVVNDLDEGPAKETAAAIAAAGGRATECAGSVSEAGFAERFIQTAVDAFGGLDIIVNNAGYTWDSVIQKMTDEQWDAILDVHLKAPFRILRAAQPVISGLVKRDRASGEAVPCRKVVNISSIAGLGGNAGQVNYAAAKAGVTGLTKALAKEWGRYNVTVNTVCPGLFDTDALHTNWHGHAKRLGLTYEDIPALTIAAMRPKCLRENPRSMKSCFCSAVAGERPRPKSPATASPTIAPHDARMTVPLG